MSSDASPTRRRRILIGIGVAVLLVAGAAAAFLLTREGNVSNPNVEFRAEPSPTMAVPSAAPTKPGKRVREPEPVWPMYGYGAERQRYLPTEATMAPPFKQVWYRNGGALLEFPPVMSGDSLYLLSDAGQFFRLAKKSGRVKWQRKLGTLAASTPAIEEDRVFATVLVGPSGSGRAVAMNTRKGRILWSKDLGARSESSPLVFDGGVFFGDEGGTVRGLDQGTGKGRWTFQAEGAVKGALALKDGKLFFGDYAGKVYAINVETGKLVWEAKTKGASFGLRAGRFYSTPAVANGRVFIGNVDGYVYSFSQSTGELAWRTKTGGFVYAAPSVAPGPGGEPTVFAGSYDGTFYAFDARSGAIKWRFGGIGRISGGSQVLNDVVYFPDLGNRKTIGLDARTGEKVFEFRKGGFATVITDGDLLYLTGYGAIYGLRPRNVKAREQRISARAEVRKDCQEQFALEAFAKRCFKRAVVERRRAACLRAPDGKRTKRFRRCVVRRDAASAGRG